MTRLLLITPYLPHRRVGHGGGTAIRSQLRHLARRHEVRVVSLVRAGEEELVDQTARELQVEIVPVPFLDRRVTGTRRLALWAGRAGALASSLAGGTPYYLRKYELDRWWRTVQRELESWDPDVLQCEYFQTAFLLREAAAWRTRHGRQRPRLVLSSHELGSLPRERRANLAADPLTAALRRWEARRWRRYQVLATRWADVTLCVTDQDRRLLEADGGARCVTVPLGVDCEQHRPVWRPGNPPRLLFVGSFEHRPNRSAALFLIDKVWPTIANYGESMSLLLVGRGSRELLATRGDTVPGVEALGFVDDLEELYRSSRLFVAPLLEGGGIKIKILEAMARGIPIVTTPIGVEGISEPGAPTHWSAAHDESFARAILAALADETEAARRAALARGLVEERFCWSVIMERLATIYEGR